MDKSRNNAKRENTDLRQKTKPKKKAPMINSNISCKILQRVKRKKSVPQVATNNKDQPKPKKRAK